MRIALALLLTALIVFTARATGVESPGWMVVALYLGFYLLLGQVGPWKARRRPPPRSEAAKAPILPTSGPIGRFGQWGLVIVFFSTQLLVLLNPFQLVQVLRQLLGNLALQAQEKRSGSDGTDRLTVVRYRLPFAGEWLLYNGGPTPETSHSWDVLGQRFALDFVIADAHGHRHQRRGTAVEDYYAYGQDILAAADGTVVAVESRIRDAPLVGWGVCDFLARSFIGNHVLIRHADDEFALYAHLVRGSVTVSIGDSVKAGDVIGRCGHTGHSSEPHLHFHVQDSPNLFRGMGRPVRFRDFNIDGTAAGDALPTAGQRLMPAPSSGVSSRG